MKKRQEAGRGDKIPENSHRKQSQKAVTESSHGTSHRNQPREMNGIQLEKQGGRKQEKQRGNRGRHLFYR
jgi:hypothetical protein